MIGKLSVGYFFMNRRKTYIAVIILSITVSIVISSNLLISGYKTEVRSISDLGVSSETAIDYIITHENGLNLTNNQIENIQRILDSYDVDSQLYFSYRNYYNVSLNGINTLIDFRVIDFQNWNDTGRFQDLNVSNRSIVSNLDETTSKNFLMHELGVPSINDGEISSEVSIIDIQTNFILVDVNSLMFEGDAFNFLELAINENGNSNFMISEISRVSEIDIYASRGYLIFLDSSFQELLSLISLLQSVLSVLLVFSITYIMFSLIEDSKEDLKLFKMIGLTFLERIMIFIFQTLLISILGFVISMLLSYFTMHFLIGFLHIFLGLPLLNLGLESSIVFWNFAYLTFISLLSGIFAILRVSNL